MSNMSYCRFNNTEINLDDCLNVLEEREKSISSEEQLRGIRMFRTFLEFCERENIIEDFDEDLIESLFLECAED